MYMSADEEYVLALYREGHTLDEGTLYAIGRIVIFIPHGSPLKPDGSLEDLEMALNDNRIKRFAIANPDHAPYGHRAEEALRHAGIWDRIRSRLVLGENVSQAAQFAASGSAQGGIIAYSLALSPNMAPLGDYDLIPAEWHNPLRQRMVLLKNAGPTAHAFYNFVQSPPARKILEQYGFALPEEYN
jgi:molybdate transport system substrate-binding protein